MDNFRRNEHLMPGEIVAIAQQGLRNCARVQRHLEQCPPCSDIHNYLKKNVFLDTDSNPKQRLGTKVTCPSTNKEIAVFITKFLKQDVSENAAMPYFKHLNNCYACFELFVVNWNGYISLLKETNQGMEGVHHEQ